MQARGTALGEGDGTLLERDREIAQLDAFISAIGEPGPRLGLIEGPYDKAKELTKVAVEESSVSLKGRNGAKGKVIVEAGQVGVQKGTKSPRIVKR